MDKSKTKIGREPGVDVPPAFFKELMAELRMTNAQLGALCGLGAHAVSWWKHEHRIPYNHLVRIENEFMLKVTNTNTARAIFIKKFFWEMNDALRSQGVELPSMPNASAESLNRDILKLEKQLGEKQDPQPSGKSEKSVQELIDEIESRGYEVFVRKVSK